MKYTDAITAQPRQRKRSVAWVYYAILTILALIASLQAPTVLVVALVCSLYATYLFRGGRFVLWIW